MRRELEAWELQERADEDALAPTYHAAHHEFPIARYWDEDFFAFVAAACPRRARILDLGCGPGSLWAYWRRLPDPERLVGVDISARMIDEARRRWPDGEFAVGRVHDLPFDDGSFDLVIASSVLHHVPDDRLADAFAQISRVLDGYGRLVGREPSNASTLGRTPGWASGAIMNFRHLVFRLTRSREFGGEELGDHHHVLDPELFLGILGRSFSLRRTLSRFPFSAYVLRADSEVVARVARALDERLQNRAGTMFYYEADKNGVTVDDVARCVELARKDETSPVSDAEFLAYLQAAAFELERLLGPAAASEPLLAHRPRALQPTGNARPAQ